MTRHGATRPGATRHGATRHGATRHGATRLAAAAALGAALAWAAPPVSGAEPAQTALRLAADAPARLVLAHWPEGGWVVRQSGRLVELTLPGAPISLATGAIPLPAGGGAITALSGETVDGAAVLRLGLGCDCTVAVRGDGERLLIDIVGAERLAGPVPRDSGAAPRLARLPRPRPTEPDAAAGRARRRQVEATRSRLLDDLRRAAEAGLVTLRHDGSGLLARLDDPALAGDGPAAGPPKPSPAEPSPAEPVLAAAAGRGEVDPGPVGPGLSVARAAEPVTPVRRGLGGPPPLVGPVAAAEPPPAATVVPAARSGDETRGDPPARRPAAACLASEAFVLPDRLPREALLGEIARLRRALVGEFDRAEPETALRLARLYIAHGLGLEAQRILAEFAPARPEARLLAAMAELVEGGPLARPNPLAVPGCSGQHALWQALDAALDGRPAAALELEAAASGALEQVASGLRGRIAARLGLAAVEAGDRIAAHRLDAMARRAVAAHDRTGQEMQGLLAGLVRRARGDRAGAVEALAGLAGARSGAGERATLVLAELLADHPATPAAPDAGATAVPLAPLRQDLGILATLHRGTPFGARAFRAELAITGRLLGRDAALGLLAYGREAALVDEADYRDMLAALGSTMPAGAGDTPLAVLYERDPAEFAPLTADAGFRRALARSYLALGSPALGERVLAAGDLRDRGLLRALAAAYLATGEVGEAGRLAARLPEGRARAAIEAAALLAGGNAGAALAAAAGVGAGPAERARLAWAAGAWQAAVEALAAAAGAADPAASDAFELSGDLAGPGDELDASGPDPAASDAFELSGDLAGPGDELDASGPDPAASDAFELSGDAAASGAAAPGPDGETAPPRQARGVLALRLALAARRAGLAGPPPEALALIGASPELAAGLSAIFEPGGIPPAQPGAGLTALMDRAAAETRLYREILDDG